MIRHTFSEGAGRAASHADALIPGASAESDYSREFDRVVESVGQSLAETLTRAWSEPRLRPVCSNARHATLAEFGAQCGSLPAFSEHRLAACERSVVLGLDGRLLLQRLDRGFGGTGDIGPDLPATLPLSASLLAQRIERQAADALATALCVGAATSGPRGGDLAVMRSFAEDAALLCGEIALHTPDELALSLTLAIEVTGAGALLAGVGSVTSAPHRTLDPLSSPTADIPLTAIAPLVEMNVPFGRIARLEAGMVLPVMLNRNVPLRIGATKVAAGTVGVVDDRVALQITQTCIREDTP